MNKIIIFILLFISCLVFGQQDDNYIYIASYNLENLFDTIDDPNKNDAEYLPSSDREWNDEKLSAKMFNLSRVIRYMNDLKGPDILGVEEVENEQVLRELIKKHFCDKNYDVVYEESPDNRGIDCGLLFDSTKFSKLEKYALEVILDDKYPTRLILGAKFLHKQSGNEICIFVNHWPSRRGGEEASEPNRIRASETLQKKLNEIASINPNSNIVIIGDFNDEPLNTSITSIAGTEVIPCDSNEIKDSGFTNLALKQYNEGLGSYLYRGDWNMLDQMIVSISMTTDEGFAYECNSFEIIMPKFAVQQDGNYKGSSLPTFGGRKYLGGFSDHFPIGAKFRFEKQ